MKNVNLPPKDFNKIGDVLTAYCRRNLPEELVFLRVRDLSLSNRILLRKAINKNAGQPFVILSSNVNVSMFAWRVSAFHFLSYPVTKNQLRLLSKKIRSQRKSVNRLKVTYKGGQRVIDMNNISVINGKGSYCEFFFKTNRPELYTVRIGNVGEHCEKIPYMFKVNKSLIINVNNLSKIEGNALYFGGEKPLKIMLGQRSIAKVKKEVIWE